MASEAARRIRSEAVTDISNVRSTQASHTTCAGHFFLFWEPSQLRCPNDVIQRNRALASLTHLTAALPGDRADAKGLDDAAVAGISGF